MRGFLDIGDPPDGTRMDIAGLDFVFIIIDNGDGTFDAQIEIAPAIACLDRIEPELPFFKFTNGNLQIMDRR